MGHRSIVITVINNLLELNHKSISRVGWPISSTWVTVLAGSKIKFEPDTLLDYYVETTDDDRLTSDLTEPISALLEQLNSTTIITSIEVEIKNKFKDPLPPHNEKRVQSKAKDCSRRIEAKAIELSDTLAGVASTDDEDEEDEAPIIKIKEEILETARREESELTSREIVTTPCCTRTIQSTALQIRTTPPDNEQQNLRLQPNYRYMQKLRVIEEPLIGKMEEEIKNMFNRGGQCSQFVSKLPNTFMFLMTFCDSFSTTSTSKTTASTSSTTTTTPSTMTTSRTRQKSQNSVSVEAPAQKSKEIKDKGKPSSTPIDGQATCTTKGGSNKPGPLSSKNKTNVHENTPQDSEIPIQSSSEVRTTTKRSSNKPGPLSSKKTKISEIPPYNPEGVVEDEIPPQSRSQPTIVVPLTSTLPAQTAQNVQGQSESMDINASVLNKNPKVNNESENPPQDLEGEKEEAILTFEKEKNFELSQSSVPSASTAPEKTSQNKSLSPKLYPTNLVIDQIVQSAKIELQNIQDQILKLKRCICYIDPNDDKFEYKLKLCIEKADDIVQQLESIGTEEIQEKLEPLYSNLLKVILSTSIDLEKKKRK